MPQTTLTQIRHDWVAISSADAGGWLAALDTQLALCTHWERSSAPGTYSTSGGTLGGYLEARNIAGIEGFKILFCGDNGSGPNYAQLCPPMDINVSYGVSQKNIIYAGTVPDDQDIDGAWNGSSAIYPGRWQELWMLNTHNASPYAGAYTHLRLVENEEQLLVVTKDVATGLRYAALLGSIIKPLSDAGSDETDTHLKGMMTSAGYALDQSMNDFRQTVLTDSYPFGNANQVNAPQIGIWSPADNSVFVRLQRMGSYFISSTGSGLLDVNGDAPMLQIPYKLLASPYTFVGFGRQWYAMADALDNAPIYNRSSVLKGSTLAASESIVYDALAFLDA